MTVRRGSRRAGRSVDELVDQLPDRFLDVDLEVEHGNMTGLSRFMSDLNEHLREQLGMHPTTDPRSEHQRPPVAEVMAELEILPSEWFRMALG